MKREETIQCHESYEHVPISLLLDGYKRKEERLKEYEELYGNRPVFVISSTAQAHSEANPKTNVKQNTNVKQTSSVVVNLNIDLPLIQREFDNLKEELENLNPKLDSDLDKIQDSFDELNPNSDQEKLAKPLNKLNRFLIKLSDPESEYNKIITGTENGHRTMHKAWQNL